MIYLFIQDKDGLPIRCPICHNTFKEPAQTKCGHSFCESCALKQYRINQRCAVCHSNTGAIFKAAKEIDAKLKKQNQPGISN